METSGDSKNYKIQKEKLWNQPHSLQNLERLEQCRANQSMLVNVAKNFANSEHGEGEIRSAMFCELLRNRDKKLILTRVSKFASLSSRIQMDLLNLASEIFQLKSWESFKVMGYEDWAVFLQEALGLNEKIAESLLTAREQALELGLNGLLQVLTTGYVVPKLQANPDKADPLSYANTLREIAEFKAGEEFRKRKALESELQETKAEMYRRVQKQQAVIDKLTKR